MASSVVVGSTGLAGSYILSTLIASDAFAAVHTISRRAPKAADTKLQAVVEPDTTQWAPKLSALTPAPAIMFSALGTTRAAAGGIKNQWKIDHDLNVELAKAAKAAGVQTFVFVSSAGTRGLIGGQFPYSKMKQGVEDAVKELAFDQAVILRPATILGEREVAHSGESWINGTVRGLGKWFGQGAQDRLGQEAEVIGRAAVHAAMLAAEGKAPEKYWVLEGPEIVRLGRTEWKS
jgi:uncharacterized protein YbjT (DUF2867 family)